MPIMLFFRLISYCLTLTGFLAYTLAAQPPAQPLSPLQVEAPSLVLSGVPFTLTVTCSTMPADGGMDTVKALGLAAPFRDGAATLKDLRIDRSGAAILTVSAGPLSATAAVRVISGWWSLLPPLIAIAMALMLKEVMLSLACGIWCGLLVYHDFNPFIAGLRLADTALVESLSDPDHASILLFTLILGGMVGIMARSGAMEGVVAVLGRLTRTPAMAQCAAWLVSLCMFFDDYANTLITGNTMRPLTDRLRISREKLAFIVDSAAAPLASIALISTWVGFELGVMNDAFASVGREAGYIVFLQCIPQRFYAILAPLFVLAVAMTGRDFGPMLAAERRARTTGKLMRDGARPLSDPTMTEVMLQDSVPRRWINAVIPVCTVVSGLFIGLYFDGWHMLGSETAPKLLDAFRAGSAFRVFMWATVAGSLVAGLLVIAQRIFSLTDAVNAWVQGVRAMMLACIVLLLAWALGSVCDMLHTADFVVAQTRDLVYPELLPALTFCIGAVISFATGTSYGTMAILFPLMVPLAFGVTSNPVDGPLHPVVLGTVGAILSGAVFGDHCSPISDTTIMSSTSAACDHIDHVNTQLPYALTVGVIALLTGYLPVGWGVPPILSLVAGIAGILLALRFFGKKIQPDTTTNPVDPIDG